MALNQPNPNGQATSANSGPVVIASDQPTIKTKLATDITPTTGTVTTSTSAVTATSLSGVGSATVSVYGTYAGVNLTFEGYDGTNWVGVPATPISSLTPAPILVTGVLGTNATVLYNISPLLGLQQLRVRATAFTSGTANIIITPSAQFVQGIQPVTGTVSATQSGTWTANMVPTGNAQSGSPLTGYMNAALTSTAIQVVSGIHRLHYYHIYNPNAATIFVQLYNTLSASVTVGTTTAFQVLAIPAGGALDGSYPVPLNWSVAITIAATTTATGNTAPTTALVVNLGYI